MNGGVTGTALLDRAFRRIRSASAVWRGMIALSLALAALGAGPCPSRAIAAAESPVGAHSMLQLSDPPWFMQIMFEEAVAMRASAIRLDVAPALVFSSPSRPPDFSGLDEVMALSRQYRLRVVADLFTIPSWIANCQGLTEPSAMDRCGTDQLSEYRSLIGQIVAHADPVIRDWEVWNEPDTPEFFAGSPQQYALMLRAAHDAIKAVDPQDDVLLGGISGVAGMSWLKQVFATPGAGAAYAFDTGNVHERGEVDQLASDVTRWKRFFASYGFAGPLWVTEHGYPANAAFQYDHGYADGPSSQAAYLAASIPTLLDAGAAEVFITERDNLGGQFASEGVLGGDVADPPVTDPQVIEKPAFAVVSEIADCYATLGRDCPGPSPAPAPSELAIPAARLGSSRSATVTLTDPAPGPSRLGSAALLGNRFGSLSIANDVCSGRLLEPAQRCSVAIRFRPRTGGAATAVLQIPSDNGPVNVTVAAVAPSVSSLVFPELPDPRFALARWANGVGYPQRLVLALTNLLSAPVQIAGTTLSGPAANQFTVSRDRCRHADLHPGAKCVMVVTFLPDRIGLARALLRVRGDGEPLDVPLRATAARLQRPRGCGGIRGSPSYPGAGLSSSGLSPSPARPSCGASRP